MTHGELVTLAMRWLFLHHYRVILTEPGYRDESPDAIGFKSGFSLLVECKATRADFLADRRKPFRQNPASGVGRLRVYLTNPGVAKPEELPERWWLLEALDDSTVRVVRGSAGDPEMCREDFFDERNHRAEAELLYSWCYRKLEGCLKPVPKSRNGLKVLGCDETYDGSMELFDESFEQHNQKGMEQ